MNDAERKVFAALGECADRLGHVAGTYQEVAAATGLTAHEAHEVMIRLADGGHFTGKPYFEGFEHFSVTIRGAV